MAPTYRERVKRRLKHCEICRDLDPYCPLELRSGDRHLDEEYDGGSKKVLPLARRLPDLQGAKEEGCKTCAMLLEVAHFYGLELYNDDDKVAINIYAGGNPEIALYRADMRKIELYSALGSGPAWENIPALPDISDSGSSVEAFTFLKGCLDMCLLEHPLCAQGSGSFPTRVLNVGQAGDSHLKLVETAGSATDTYVALSYCWGETPTLKTTSSNLRKMKDGIAISEMPRTLQDAILLTRKLGQRFIWIDAFCIIQDDLADWERESAKMAEVYEHAHVTIAASSSGSAGEGLFSPRATARPFSFARINEEGASLVIKTRLTPDSGLHYRHRPFSPLVPDPWALRAWTLQERALSTRVISFSSSEIQWICKSRVTCECGWFEKTAPTSTHLPVTRLENRADAFRFWHDTVMEYSKRSLTVADDKLPALSGIASALRHRTGSLYLSGLWIDNIISDLSWERKVTPEDPSPQALLFAYRAPSFSWASIEEEIYYNTQHRPPPYQIAAQMLDFGSTVIGANPYGRVDNAWVQLRSHLIPTSLNEDSTMPNHGSYIAVLDGQKNNFYADCELEEFSYISAERSSQRSACRSHPNATHAQQPGTSSKASGSAPFVNSIRRLGRDVPCWALYLGFWTSDGPFVNNRVVFMMVGKSPQQPKFYERLGLFSFKPKMSRWPMGFDDNWLQTITVI